LENELKQMIPSLMLLVAGPLEIKSFQNLPVEIAESGRIAKSLGERVAVNFEFGYLKRAAPAENLCT
jgi:hypothetical protein